jgi:SAM-dependent methyltransferase
MKGSLLEVLYCPNCHDNFRIDSSTCEHGEVREGTLTCLGCDASFPVINYIPRLVEQSNYSSSWGQLWHRTAEITRDSFTGVPFYYNALFGQYSEEGREEGYSPFGFGWPTNLTGQKILEVGPGTGNCTEHLVNTDARLVCVDMSDAVDTFPEALLTRPNIDVIQGDINEPFLPAGYFDRIWLFQVLQHTPSPLDTLKTLYKLLRERGELAFTSYAGRFSPWYYHLTKRIGDETAWRLVAYWVPRLVPLKYRLRKAGIPVLSGLLVKLLHPFDPRDIYFNTLEGKADAYVHGVL